MRRDFLDIELTHQCSLVYSVKSADVEFWDEWWINKAYCWSRPILSSDLDRFMLALQDMVNQGETRLEFLMQMPAWDRAEWIQRARRDCNRFHGEDPDGFPPCGIVQSFRQLRDLRKRRAEEGKRMNGVQKMSLGD